MDIKHNFHPSFCSKQKSDDNKISYAVLVKGKQVTPSTQHGHSHSEKSEEFVKNTTTALKYIPGLFLELARKIRLITVMKYQNFEKKIQK